MDSYTQYLTWKCPCCGEYLYTDSKVYKDQMDDVIGCEFCISQTVAEDYFKEERA